MILILVPGPSSDPWFFRCDFFITPRACHSHNVFPWPCLSQLFFFFKFCSSVGWDHWRCLHCIFKLVHWDFLQYFCLSTHTPASCPPPPPAPVPSPCPLPVLTSLLNFLPCRCFIHIYIFSAVLLTFPDPGLNPSACLTPQKGLWSSLQETLTIGHQLSGCFTVFEFNSRATIFCDSYHVASGTSMHHQSVGFDTFPSFMWGSYWETWCSWRTSVPTREDKTNCCWGRKDSSG